MDYVDKLWLDVYNEIERLINLRALVNSLKDGDTLQFKCPETEWVDVNAPVDRISINPTVEYRIKPREPRTVRCQLIDGHIAVEIYQHQEVIKFVEVMKQP